MKEKRKKEVVVSSVTLHAGVHCFNRMFLCSILTEGRSVPEPGVGLRPRDRVQSRQTLQPSQTDPPHALRQGVYEASFFPRSVFSGFV